MTSRLSHSPGFGLFSTESFADRALNDLKEAMVFLLNQEGGLLKWRFQDPGKGFFKKL